MKKLLAIAVLAICPVFAYAQVDVGAAFGSALVTIVIRGAIAFALFKLITVNLTRKTTFTPVENGRWIGACLLGSCLLSFPSTNKSVADFYYGITIASVGWLLIGFLIGYAWRMYRPLILNETIAPKVGGTSSIPMTQKNPDTKSKSISSVLSDAHTNLEGSELNLQANNSLNEEAYWESAFAELNSDKRREGLWAMCFANANGDENIAKAAYLKTRAEQFKETKEPIDDSVSSTPEAEPITEPVTPLSDIDKYKITFDGEKYQFQNYRYTDLNDAIRYAQILEKRLES